MEKITLLTAFLFVSFLSFGQCPTTIIMLTSQADVDSFSTTYPGCTSPGNGMLISGNGISNLSGLSNLSYVGGGFSITNNPLLTSLSGLEGLNGMSDFELTNNNLLSDISAFENMEIYEFSDVLTISGNPSLSECSITAICDRIRTNIGVITIENNNTDCNNYAEVFSNCIICPLIHLALSSQAEVDAFATNYPNCTNLINPLDIEGNDITDLSGLSQIEAFDYGSIRIQHNPVLESLDGLGPLTLTGVTAAITLTDNPLLSSISSLEGSTIFEGYLRLTSNPMITSLEAFSSQTGFLNIRIDGCDAITDLSGLEGVTSINSLEIRENDNLQNISALSNISGRMNVINIHTNNSLTTLSGLEGIHSVWDGVIIRRCPSLSNLDGLSGLTNEIAPQNSMGISITANQILDDISALENIDYETLTEVFIYDNPALSKCDAASVCSFLTTGNTVLIENNSVGCNSIQEVVDDCATVDIPDANFLSALLNHNPIIDTDGDNGIQYAEAGAFTGTISANNQNISDFTGLEAFVNITGFNGAGNQIVTLRLDDNTALTSVIFENNSLLEAVNLKNGNNTSITNFQGLNCPSLQFVCVDDVTFAEANFTNIDAQVVFTIDCGFLAVPTFDIQKSVTMFPNPVSDILQIHVAYGIVFEKAVVYSVLGEELFFTSEENVDYSQLAAGVYFVKVITNRGSFTKKIIKN